MISASTAFAGEVERSSRFFSVKLYNDNLDVSGSIRNVTVHLGSCGDQTFQAGAVFTSYIEVTLDEMVTRLQGLELRLDVGVLTGSTYDYITLGYFTCGAPETSEYQTSFTAQGRIGARFNNEFIAPGVQSLSALAGALGDQTGVSVSFAAGIADGVITKEMSGLTCREALEVLAGAVGGFATETPSGQVVVRKYSDTPTKTVTGDVMRDLPTSADYDFTINGIRVIVSPETTEDDGTVTPEVSYQAGDVNVQLEDEYMTQDLFSQMSAGLIGLAYRPATVTMALGDPRLEASDVLKVERSDGSSIIVPCMSVEHSFDGGWQTRIIAPGPEETGFILGATGKAVQQLKMDMLQVKRLFANYARIDLINVDRIESKDGSTYWDLNTNEVCLGGYLLRAAPEYALGDSATSPPESGWSETAPARTEGKYLWQRIALSQGDGTTNYTAAVCIQGADGKGITEAVIEYAQSQSGTSPPGSGWGPDIPSVQGGDYLWSRTTITYTDGSRSQTYTTSKQGEKGDTGEDAILLRIDSSNGMAFKNNAVSTVLSVVIYHGQTRIETSSQLAAEFGSSARLQWEWLRMGEDVYGTILTTDSRLSDKGFHFTLSPDDVDTKVTFRCNLII